MKDDDEMRIDRERFFGLTTEKQPRHIGDAGVALFDVRIVFKSGATKTANVEVVTTTLAVERYGTPERQALDRAEIVAVARWPGLGPIRSASAAPARSFKPYPFQR